MNAITYDEIERYRYMWYTKKEIRRIAKARAFKHGSKYLIITFDNDMVECYQRHNTRWYKQ